MSFAKPSSTRRPNNRRHGEPFPLPIPADESDWWSGLSFGQRSRVQRSLQALNHLAASEQNSFVSCYSYAVKPRPDSSPPALRPTATQLKVLDSVRRRIVAHADVSVSESAGQVLEGFLRSSHHYGMEPNNLAEYNADHLKVLKRDTRPKELLPYLCGQARLDMQHYATFIEKTPAERALIADTAEPIQPYWDPKLRASKGARWGLFLKLWKTGLLGFVSNYKASVGLFFVKKKRPGEIRMVVDARQANRLHKPPPSTRLGTAGSYVDLDLSGDDHEDFGFGPLASDFEPAGAEADVCDCFWNWSIDPLSEWFGIPEEVTFEELVQMGFKEPLVWDSYDP